MTLREPAAYLYFWIVNWKILEAGEIDLPKRKKQILKSVQWYR